MRKVPEKGSRQVAMVMMTLLMHTSDLDEAAAIYSKLHILLCTRLDSDTVQQTFQDVTDRIKHTIPDADDDVEVEDNAVDQPIDDVADTMDHESATTIKQQSPFTQHFAASLGNLQRDNDFDSGKRNGLYCPDAFKVITDVMHLYPLWAAALHGNVSRFALDLTDTVSEIQPPRNRSNAIVESHFKTVKHGHKKSRKLRPRLFLTERLRSVLARVNQTAIKFPVTRKRRRAAPKDDPASAPEVWNRTPKRRRYGDKDVSLRILRHMHITPPKSKKKVSTIV